MTSKNVGEHSGTKNWLPRGAACVSCRRRRIKCDGEHPICTQCDQGERTEDCEYRSGTERSTVQVLEDNIRCLETRIQELQNSSTTPSAVSLYQPYNGADSWARKPSTPSKSGSRVQEPPRHVAEKLIAGFLIHATQLGFFLNVPRFQASFFINQPTGHPSRPASVLISSTYLWAIRLSHDPSVKTHEATFLDCATQDAATALSGTHPDKVMHSIQAEVLLATYLFANGRFFEGKDHVATAVSMVFSAGLHRIRSATSQQQALVSGTNNRLHNPRDLTEEGERILAFWAVLDLDKSWAVALEHEPIFEYSTHPLATKVDTPWPLEMEEFIQGRLPPHARTSNTIQNFLHGVPTFDVGISFRAIEAKTAVLWERVAVFSRRCSTYSSPQDVQPFLQELTGLSAMVENLIGLLPLTDPQTLGRIQNVEKARRLGVVYSMLCATTIRLHAPFAIAGRSDSSKRKRLAMAIVILELALSLRVRGKAYLNPIIGTVWIAAAQVVFEEVAAIRSTHYSGDADDRALMCLVQQATKAMTAFNVNVPLNSYQVGKIQEIAQSI